MLSIRSGWRSTVGVVLVLLMAAPGSADAQRRTPRRAPAEAAAAEEASEDASPADGEASSESGASSDGESAADATEGGEGETDGAEGAESVDAEATVDEARRRYAQGSEFYRRGRFAEAVAEFSEAYSLWENPTILYAMGQAYEGLGDVNRAIETYQTYLGAVDAEDVRRGDVEARIDQLQGLLATVHVQSNVEAIVFVDDEEVGTAPGEIRVPTGRHSMELRADGYVTQSASFTIAGGTERTVNFELEAVAPITLRVERQRYRFPRPVFYAAAGVTGASLLIWAGMATSTVVHARRYNDRAGRTNYDREDARDYAQRSNVALGITAGLAASTAVIGVLTKWRREPRATENASDDTTEDTTASVEAGVAPLPGGVMLTAGWSR